MKKIAIVVSRFNENVTERLLSRCVETLEENGWSKSGLRIVKVPGGFEIAWAAAELARSKNYEVIIALGCILKGQTPQNDHMSAALIAELTQLSTREGVPITLGVITPNTMAQALARTKGALDRGKEAALAALSMAKLRREMAHGS